MRSAVAAVWVLSEITDVRLANLVQECGGGFDDGQYFLRGDSTDPVYIRCEDRRLKA